MCIETVVPGPDHEDDIRVCGIQQVCLKSFSARNILEKSQLLECGRPTPDLKTVTTVYKNKNSVVNRRFNPENYKRTTWLAGCSTLKKLFCWPCLLFNPENSVWSKLLCGYDDLNNLSSAIRRHSLLKTHINAVLSLEEFGKNPIDEALIRAREMEKVVHNETVRKNREILIRLIDTVLLLANQELAFRGHDESTESNNRGNYIELLSYLAKYDKPLAEHLNTATIFRGTSNRIQNDLIESIAQVLQNAIKKEIEESQNVAVILDETSDVDKKSQLSNVFRYCHKGKVHERFYSFEDVSKDRTAEGLFKHVKKTVDSIVKNGEKLVAQGYDGAAVMSGELNGLQAKVREIYVLAIFIHCIAHVLNLVLSQVAKCISECTIFFETLQGFASFFSVSTKRVTLLMEIVKRKFPQVCPTRWCFKSKLVTTVYESRVALIELFTDISEKRGEWSGSDIVMAKGFLATLHNFKFNFLLKSFSLIFDHTDIMFNVLQTEGIEIDTCLSMVETAMNFIHSNQESGSAKIYDETESLVGPDEKRRRTNVHPRTQYELLYQNILKTIETEMTTRFQYLRNIKFIDLLNHQKFKQFEPINGTFPQDLLDNLKETYRHKFDYSKLKSELCVLYQSDNFQGKSIIDIYTKLDGNLRATFSQTWLLCDLILTLPSTTVKAERSFSALKRILNYLRNSMGQNRLSSLAVISIERELLSTLRSNASFYDLVITEFLRKERRADFIYRR